MRPRVYRAEIKLMRGGVSRIVLPILLTSFVIRDSFLLSIELFDVFFALAVRQ